MTQTTNLILYGPPGTGKTYATAEWAVRLSGELVPKERSDLIATYQRLVADGRIEFVTFHQSMSYEEFIEGRQPVTGADEEAETSSEEFIEGNQSMAGMDDLTKISSVGFRLKTIPGVFRQIAKRAETSRGRLDGGAFSIDGQAVYKMSIGANTKKDSWILKEAFDKNCIILGWEDIDWTDSKYKDVEAILDACRQQGKIDGKVTRRVGQVAQTHDFRNILKKNDIIIVSKGNGLFQAVGKVVGEYKYERWNSEGKYSHRRNVEWLWRDKTGLGVPVRRIYQRDFAQRAIHQLEDKDLNVQALKQLVEGGRARVSSEMESFVLVIDEINRANISKVFGELITLLEPDKRLGQENELTVRLPYSGDKFGLPSNLHIVGTMNTADRSIALLDTALRRRFTFREMMPDPNALESDVDGINLQKLLRVINDRIEYLFDREHQIGHAYFMTCKTSADVEEVMRHKVIPLLAEYFYEDWSKVAAVLGDVEQAEPRFLIRERIAPPERLEHASGDRFRWRVKPDSFDFSEFSA